MTFTHQDRQPIRRLAELAPKLHVPDLQAGKMTLFANPYLMHVLFYIWIIASLVSSAVSVISPSKQR